MTDTNKSTLRKRPTMYDIVKIKTDIAQRLLDESHINDRLSRIETRLSQLETRIYDYDLREMCELREEYAVANKSEEM